MVVRMRHTKSHTANRRSHHALKNKGFFKCENCGAPKLMHKACAKCGTYMKRKAVDIVGKLEKKGKKTKAKVAKK